MRRVTILLIALLFCPAIWGQASLQMRTRILTHMANTEIEQYLKRNDVIFIPVGTVPDEAVRNAPILKFHDTRIMAVLRTRENVACANP